MTSLRASVGARLGALASRSLALTSLTLTSLALMSMGACASGRPAPTIDGVRRPDGVTIDPASALPEPGASARTTEGAVTLRTPLGTDAAFEILDAYVRAIVGEDSAAMATLHTSDATFVVAAAGQAPRGFPATGVWERRFGRLDYGALAGSVVVRTAEASVRRVGREQPTAEVAPSDEDMSSTPFRDAEVVVTAPVATSRVGGQSLLGSEIVLYLRRVDDGYRVSAVAEDFALP